MNEYEEVQDTPPSNGRVSLNGHSPVIDYGEEIKIPQFSALSTPIQLESVIDSSRKLAWADRESKAYDRFLFGGDGVASDGTYTFPAEDLIAQRLNLEGARAAALGKRDLLKGLVQRLTLQSHQRSAAEKLAFLEAKLERLTGDRAEHGSRLDGQTVEADGINWTGMRRDPGNWVRTRWALWSPMVTLLFVASVDMLVLMMSLAAFLGGDWDGIAFSIPALGIQVFFPHLIGERLAKVVRGKRQIWVDLGTAAFFGAIWIAFAYLIAVVRSLYLDKIANQEIRSANAAAAQVLAAEHAAQRPFALPLTLLIILGLGIWLIFTSFKNNPHELAYLRLGIEIEKLEKRIAQCRTEESLAAQRVQLQDRALSLLEKNVLEHVSEIETKYVEVGRRAYRRSLVNAFGEPDFTTAATKGVTEVEG